MRTTICGVSLLILGSIGVTAAHAAPFGITVSGATGADGSVTFSLSGDTSGKRGQFTFGEREQAPNFLDWLETSFDDRNAEFKISNQSELSNGLGVVTRSADFVVFDPDFNFTVTDTGGPSQVITGYSFEFHVALYYDTLTGIPYDGFGASSMLLIPPESVLSIGVVGVSGNPFVPSVPLPSSLPMMAAACFGLALVGHARRRTSTLTI